MGGGSPNIGGFEANRILLVLDGVRLNNAIYRSGHLQNIITIDQHIIEDVEVIFGLVRYYMAAMLLGVL